jgi:hypothetical protein
MPDVISPLKKRILEVKGEIDRQRRLLAAYEETLAMELGQKYDRGVLIPEHKAGGTNKAAFIRNVIQEGGTFGVTYTDIGQALSDSAIETSPNYRYTLVNKWKATKQVEERDGRIYWVSK